MTETIKVYPDELLPGDVVVSTEDKLLWGGDYITEITVAREIPPDIARAISELPESVFRSLNEHS